MKIVTEFTVKLTKRRKIEDIIKASNYDEVNFLITEGIRKKRLSLQNEEIGERTIVILGSDESVSSNDVLSEARRLGLVRPSYSDAFLVGEQHPDEQIGGPIVFLHDPQYSWSGHSFNFVLDISRRGRIITFISSLYLLVAGGIVASVLLSEKYDRYPCLNHCIKQSLNLLSRWRK